LKCIAVETAARGEGRNPANLPRHRTRGKEDVLNRFKNSLIALAGTLALIAVVAAFTPGTTQGQSGSTPPKDVTVVNTPTVNLAEGARVGIDPARNTVKVDESAREPVTINLEDLIQTSPNFYSTKKFLIPKGKRLVIEHIYGGAFRTEATTSLPEFHLRSWFGDSPVSYLKLSYTQQPGLDSGSIVKFSFTQPVKFYVSNPADDAYDWRVSLTSFNHGPGEDIFLSGYLEPLP
jgi:hypothetical protein